MSEGLKGEKERQRQSTSHIKTSYKIWTNNVISEKKKDEEKEVQEHSHRLSF